MSTPITHGRLPWRLYRIWAGMLTRCRNPKNGAYKYYGGKGVQVCKEWEDYAVFRDWALLHGYNETLEIDRADSNGPYSPGNCKWSTRAQQMRNRTNCTQVEAFGERKTIQEWVKDPRCCVGWNAIRNRLRKGIAPETAITQKVVL